MSTDQGFTALIPSGTGPPPEGAVPGPTPSDCLHAHCLTCLRDVALAPQSEPYCPVCSSILLTATNPTPQSSPNAEDIPPDLDRSQVGMERMWPAN